MKQEEKNSKKDLELWLGNCESDVADARNDIEHDFSSKIDSKILRHLEHIYQFQLFQIIKYQHEEQQQTLPKVYLK